MRSIFRDNGQTTRTGAYRASEACVERKAAEQIAVPCESISYIFEIYYSFKKSLLRLWANMNWAA